MSKDITLYNITEEFAALERLVMDSDGEIAEDHEKLERECFELLANKTDGYVGFVHRLESEIEQAECAIERLTQFRKARERAAERCTQYVKECMGSLKTDCFKGVFTEIKKEAARERVEIFSRDDIPVEYITVKQEYQVEKKKIGDAIRRGESVPGAKIVLGDEPIRYKIRKVGDKKEVSE